MGPAAKQTWAQVGKGLAKHGTWGVVAAILLQAFGPSIAEAVADRISGPPSLSVETITSNAVVAAVAVADAHLERRAQAIEQQLGALTLETRSLAAETGRMAAETQRMANKQEVMNDRMNQVVGELKRIQ